MDRLRLGVLASGQGTDFQSIIDAVESGELSVDISILICNNPEAFALERARNHSIFHAVVDHEGRKKEDFERELISRLEEKGVGLVVLAGFMRILSPSFVERFQGRVMNIHPSLLPSFPGAHAHRDALAYGVKVSGCTIHFVTEEVDGGPVILQKAVDVLPGDTEGSLGERVLEQEHILLPRAIELFAQGRLKIQGRMVRILDE